MQAIANLRVKEATDHSATRIIMIKVLTDNLLAGPICLHAYFAGIGFLEGLSTYEIAEKTQVRH